LSTCLFLLPCIALWLPCIFKLLDSSILFCFSWSIHFSLVWCTPFSLPHFRRLHLFHIGLKRWLPTHIFPIFGYRNSLYPFTHEDRSSVLFVVSVTTPPHHICLCKASPYFAFCINWKQCSNPFFSPSGTSATLFFFLWFAERDASFHSLSCFWQLLCWSLLSFVYLNPPLGAPPPYQTRIYLHELSNHSPTSFCIFFCASYVFPISDTFCNELLVVDFFLLSLFLLEGSSLLWLFCKSGYHVTSFIPFHALMDSSY